MKNKLFISGLAVLLLWSCTQKKADERSVPRPMANPAAEGFNSAASDSAAIAIADSVMIAMGGRKAWDSIHYISWNFFGLRDLIWDKPGNKVRIEQPDDSTIYLLNMNDMTGRVKKGNEEITNADSLKKYLERAKSIWINDSYWLVMPYKLKDSGVTLKYLREDTTMSGIKAHVLQLTFDNVGNTPDNKYEVYVDRSDKLVKQWAYFRYAHQDSASAVWPWDNYRKYNGILLSANRSDNKGPRDVEVSEDIAENTFSEF